MYKAKCPYELWHGIALPPAAVRLIESAPMKRISKAEMLRFRNVGIVKLRKLERMGAMYGYVFTDDPVQRRPRRRYRVVGNYYYQQVESTALFDTPEEAREENRRWTERAAAQGLLWKGRIISVTEGRS